MGDMNLEINLIEKLDLLSRDDEFSRKYDAKVKGYQSDFITLENGAEAMFVRPGDLDRSKKHPMVTLLHGGPFAAYPWHFFSVKINTYLL